jgi:hypothetical protein
MAASAYTGKEIGELYDYPKEGAIIGGLFPLIVVLNMLLYNWLVRKYWLVYLIKNKTFYYSLK